MSPLQRVLGTLTGQPVDRRAVAPVLSLYGARLTDCPLERYYADPVAYVRGQSAVRATFAPDLLFAPFCFALLGAAFGSQIKFAGTQAPQVRHPVLASAADWSRLVWPDPATDPQLRYLLDTIRLLAQTHGAEVPIALALPPPADLPVVILGLEPWLDTVLSDGETAQHILATLEPFWVDFANRCFAAGATLVALTSAFTSPAIVPPGLVTSFGRPALQRVLPALRGPTVLHHVGAPLLPHLALLTGLPGVVGFALDARDDLAQARGLVGPTPLLLGGPHGPSLPEMPPELVRTHCATLLENRRHDPRFLLVTSGADIPYPTPAASIHALREAAAAGPAGPAPEGNEAPP